MLNSDDPTCRCCKARRAASDLEPRRMTPVFLKGREGALWMCPHCDGDALKNAKYLERQHMSGS